MTRPDTENSDPLPTQTNQAETRKKNFQVAGLLFLACVFVAFTKSGWVAVMLGLSVAPLETLATQLGVVIVPFVGGWVIARGLKLVLKEVAFNTVWLWCVVVLSVAILFSAPQGTATSAAKNRDASVPKSTSGVTNAKTFSFESAVCSEAMYDRQWSTALTVCSKAANQGDRLAQFYLGALYEQDGEGTFPFAKDYALAIHWYAMAAKQGHTDAQFALGMIYEDGLGVGQDYVRAHMWYNVAAANGYGKASRDVVASKMTREQIAEAQKMARDCTAKSYKSC